MIELDLKKDGSVFIAFAIARDYFPSTDEWYGIEAIDAVSEELRADALKATFDHFFQKQQKLKSDSLPGIRQLTLYGTAPFKMIFENKEQEIIALQRFIDSAGKNKIKRI